MAIFTPIYLGVVVPGRWFIRHQEDARLQALVRGATAAAAGAIAGATIVLTRQAIVDPTTAAIALVSLVVLWRYKLQEPLIVLVCGGLGLLLY